MSLLQRTNTFDLYGTFTWLNWLFNWYVSTWIWYFNHTYAEYRPVVRNWEPGRRSALVSINQGTTTNYAIMGVEDRGQMFVGAGIEVYEE